MCKILLIQMKSWLLHINQIKFQEDTELLQLLPAPPSLFTQLAVSQESIPCSLGLLDVPRE